MDFMAILIIGILIVYPLTFVIVGIVNAIRHTPAKHDGNRNDEDYYMNMAFHERQMHDEGRR